MRGLLLIFPLLWALETEALPLTADDVVTSFIFDEDAPIEADECQKIAEQIRIYRQLPPPSLPPSFQSLFDFLRSHPQTQAHDLLRRIRERFLDETIYA